MGHHFVWEDSNPDLATSSEVVGDRTPRRFNLASRDPGGFLCLNADVAKCDAVPGCRHAAALAAEHSTILRSLGLKHVTRPPPALLAAPRKEPTAVAREPRVRPSHLPRLAVDLQDR